MPVWKAAPDLEALAARVIAKLPEQVGYVDPDEVLFLWEIETISGAQAKCFSLDTHPIGYFTDKRWAIVFYRQNVDYMSWRQLAILMLHELKHIPLLGIKLRDHNVKDFLSVLALDLHWSEPGRDVPNILE